MLRGGVGSEPLRPGERLPSQGGEGKQAKIKIHTLLIKPRNSLISFKKNGGNPLHPKGEKSLFSRISKIPKSAWRSVTPGERHVWEGRESSSRAAYPHPPALRRYSYTASHHPLKGRVCWPRSPWQSQSRETPPLACKNWSRGDPGLHRFGPSPARPAPQLHRGRAPLAEETKLQFPPRGCPALTTGPEAAVVHACLLSILLSPEP